jgi:hypothetical protein
MCLISCWSSPQYQLLLLSPDNDIRSGQAALRLQSCLKSRPPTSDSSIATHACLASHLLLLTSSPPALPLLVYSTRVCARLFHVFHVQLLSLDSRTQEAFPQQEDVCFDSLLLLAISTDAQHIHGHRHATAERRFRGLVVVFSFRFFLTHIQKSSTGAGQISYLLVVKRPFKEPLRYKKDIVIIAIVVFRAISALHNKLVVISICHLPRSRNMQE